MPLICAGGEVRGLISLFVPWQFPMKSRSSVLQLARNCHKYQQIVAGFGSRRHSTPAMDNRAQLQPARRVQGRKQDVWYVSPYYKSLLSSLILVFSHILRVERLQRRSSSSEQGSATFWFTEGARTYLSLSSNKN